jgi:hypothetical protein
MQEKSSMYTYADMLRGMRAHYDNLDAALWRHGFRRGELSADQFRAAHRALSSTRAADLGYTNPWARQVWERHLRRAIVACNLHEGPLLMATVLDRRWHFPWGTWGFAPEAMALQAELAFGRVPYLLQIEFAPLTYSGEKLVAPHLQGFVLEDLSRRRKDKIKRFFSGGLAGADPLHVQPVWDFAGACRYNVKSPDRMWTCTTDSESRRWRKSRPMSGPQHYYLWRHLHRYAYPQLTLAGGVGKRVLELAMNAAGYDVP